MTRRRAESRFLPLNVVVAVFALFAVACGSGTAVVSAERVVDAQAAPPPPVETTHEYGTSIDEWVESPSKLDFSQESDPARAEEVAGADESDAATVAWEDLIPPGSSGEDIFARYEADLNAMEPGSEEANALYDEMLAEFDPEAVNFELDGQQIRLAGFVAPLDYYDDLVTEFLLVPTFGACIHVPPPPPNQTIMVTLENTDGLTTDESWGAVWVEGTLTVAATETDLASASYVITNATSGSYNDF